MPIKPKSISTAADELLIIVKREGEMRLDDVAKKLGVPRKTVEAWSTFLEEEGLLAIKYKLTTPYLTMPEKKDKKEENIVFRGKLEAAEVKSDLATAEELLSQSVEHKRKGEFTKLKQSSNEIIRKLNSAYESLVAREELSDESRKELKDKLDGIQQQHAEAEGFIEQGKFDRANLTYSEISKALEVLLAEMKKTFSKLARRKALGVKDIRELLAKAYAAIEVNNIEEAREYYNDMKTLHTTMSKEYVFKKKELQEDIIKLNRDVSIAANRIKQEVLVNSAANIHKLLKEAGNSISRKDFKTATAYYLEIKKIFESLPEGSEKEKRHFQENILKLYEQIAKERGKNLLSNFNYAAKEIDDLLKETKQYVKKEKVALATKSYMRLRKLYNDLPSGFLKEKVELQDKIMPVYTLLAKTHEATAETTLALASGKIRQQLLEMKQLMDRNRLQEAHQKYAEIKSLFQKLPEGFVRAETELQSHILKTYEALLEKEHELTTSTFTSSIGQITGLIEHAVKVLGAGHYIFFFFCPFFRA